MKTHKDGLTVVREESPSRIRPWGKRGLHNLRSSHGLRVKGETGCRVLFDAVMFCIVTTPPGSISDWS